MDSKWVTAIGFAAAFGTTAAWLPQVLKTWKTRVADDFSWGYLAMFSSGVALWLAYGLLKKDMAVMVANAVTLVLVAGVAWVKLRQKR